MWKLLLIYLFVIVQVATIDFIDLCATARQNQIAIGLKPDQPSSEYSIQMCNTSRSGLPKCFRCQNIAIVGAGVAGLTAAVELALAGHRITIYEASNRTGGRILTHREPGTNFVTELGAMRLPLNEHALLQAYIDQRFNLAVGDFANSNPNAFVFLNNVLQTVRRTEEQPNAFGFDLTPEESKMVRISPNEILF
jgi:hypothetical protein